MNTKTIRIALFATMLSTDVVTWAQSAAKKQPGAASMEIRAEEVGAQMKALLSQPIAQLAAGSKRLASEVNASLVYDREIARHKTWEQLLQETRVELIESADHAGRERAELKQELQKEMKDVRETHGDGAEADQQLVLVIQSYRETLLLLKEQEDSYRRQINQVDVQRMALRQQRLVLERGRRMAQQGLDMRAKVLPALPGLPVLDTAMDVAPKFDPREKIADAIKSIEGL